MKYDIPQLLKDVEQYNAKIARNKGRWDQIRSQLVKGFGVDSLEGAEDLLKQIEQVVQEAEKNVDKLVAAYDKKHGERLKQFNESGTPPK